MFKVGAIQKIELTNFVTHSHLEFYPSPNLNMIIGPNGSGKSTIVGAIILGLGGNPKTVGRGKKISEYIQHNCDRANITIYLQGPDEISIKITRIITMDDKSTWLLNDKKVKMYEINECVKNFNIQIDNLCQFLPQDRIKEFSKLNEENLLIETQRALCRFDLIDKQNMLISISQEHQIVQNEIKQLTKDIENAREANLHLENKVESFRLKQNFLTKIQDIERKIAWITYEYTYLKCSRIKDELKEIEEKFTTYNNNYKPIEKKISLWQKNVSVFNNKITESKSKLIELKNKITNTIEKFNNSRKLITQATNEELVELAKIEQTSKDSIEIENKITDLKNIYEKLNNEHSNSADVTNKTKFEKELIKIQTFQRTLKDKINEITDVKDKNFYQISALDNKMKRLENIRHDRMNYLQRIDTNAYEAVLWLRDNKQKFKKEIYEPIMLELNLLEKKNAKYLENVISKRDKLAFICTSKEDMNELLIYFRNQRKMTINAIYVGESNDYQPTLPIEVLQKFGFYAYINSLIKAPTPIMTYLCSNYKIHNIPVGNDKTDTCIEDIPNSIRLFFSNKYRYSVNFSKYSNNKSIIQSSFKSDGTLSMVVDVEQLDNVKGKCDTLKKSVLRCDKQINDLNNQNESLEDSKKKLVDELKQIDDEKKKIGQLKEHIKSMEDRLAIQKTKKKDPNNIKIETKNKIQIILNNMETYLENNLLNIINNYIKMKREYHLNLLKLSFTKAKIRYLENDASITKNLCDETKELMISIKEKYEQSKIQCKLLLKEAKNISKGFTPNDDGFDEFRNNYNLLPDNLTDLQNQLKDLLAKTHLLNTADDDEIQQYENRLKIIKIKQKSIEKQNNKLLEYSTKISTLKEEWLNHLNKLIESIDKQFALSFSLIGCKGQVCLKIPENQMDFNKYGLCINVSYRNDLPTQQLNDTLQSGGERSVATGAFMLALQELTPVPFRCVDEINQGMDEFNEKKIFQILVENTTKINTSQYFLITPKLVPNLSYTDNMMVHVVHNGPFIDSDSKWSKSKFCNLNNLT